MTPELKGFLLVSIIKILAVFTVIQVGVMMVIWAERRISAWIQDRLGPNRVGPQGLLQSVADGVKNFAKEETIPSQAERTLFFLAPAISFIPAMITIAVIPFAAPLPLPAIDFWFVHFDPRSFTIPLLGFLGEFSVTEPVPMVIADLPVGFLYVLAITSVGIYGVVLAGWSSGSKYALLGGLRSSAQLISYEIAAAMTLISLMIVAGNVSVSEVISRQQQSTWFVLPLFLAFVMFLITAFAETNRLPFDLPETESELVTGYHTEYSSMKFSFFFIAEYANLMTAAALIVSLFFGGWDIPFTTWDEAQPGVLQSLATLVAFVAKTLFFVFLYIWVRWTLPRFRFDQVMELGWKVLLPMAIGYVAVIAVTVFIIERAGVAFGWRYALILTAVNLVAAYGIFWHFDRGRLIKGSRAGRERRAAA